MTIPLRPAPPPPTSSQNGGVIQNNNNNNLIKLPPPPVSKKFPINHSSSSNGSISSKIVTSSSLSSHNSTKSIVRNFPAAKTRYAPTTNWDGSAFDVMSSSNQKCNNSSNVASCGNKRMPPPRPPPPRLHTHTGPNSNGVLKKPGPPQSVNVLSNLFGRRNKPNSSSLSKKPVASQIISKNTSQSFNSNENSTYQGTGNISTYSSFSGQRNNSPNLFETAFSSTSRGNNEVQLISFDSPPSSPTFTQKSNSDCVSVDSFSSDSNCSPNNGSVSQPESGFEDDFSARTTSPPDPWETISNPMFVSNKITNNCSGREFGNNHTNYMTLNELQTVHPVRNMNVLNKVQTENHLCNGKSLLPPNPTLPMPTIIRPNKGLAPKPPIPKPNLSQQNELQNNRIIYNSGFEDPPMPTGPPPPPPSDVTYNDEYVTEDESAYGISLYAFDGAENGDLSFRENEKIYLISKLNNEWFMGRAKNGCEGIFPSNFINIKVPLKDSDQIKQNTESQNQGTSEILHERKIKVLYNFEAEQPEDLTIYENDIVNVLYKINEDWLFGKINNRHGQFPSNFIEYVPPDLPKMP